MATPQLRGLAGLVAAFLVGGLGVGVALGTESPEDAPKEVISDPSPHPLVQDTIEFRSSPGWRALLWGGTEEARAIGMLNRACKTSSVADAGAKTSTRSGPHIPEIEVSGQSFPLTLIAVPKRAGVQAEMVDLTPIPIAYDETGEENADAPVVSTCPVKLVIEAGVSSPSSGYLLAADVEPNSSTEVTSDVLVPYTLTQIISPVGYLLLGGSALLVALCGLLTVARYNRPRWKEFMRRAQGGADPKYSIIAGVSSAFAIVATGAITWSDLVPSLHLGGVTVILLVAGVSVAVGEAIARVDSKFRAAAGHFLRIFGIAVLALLTPFVLLHGGDIGRWSMVAWCVLVLALILLAWFILPPVRTSTSEAQQNAASEVGGGEPVTEVAG